MTVNAKDPNVKVPETMWEPNEEVWDAFLRQQSLEDIAVDELTKKEKKKLKKQRKHAQKAADKIEQTAAQPVDAVA